MASASNHVATRLYHCARAIAERLSTDPAIQFSPDGFRYRGRRVVYEPPAHTRSLLYMAPEVPRLEAPPSDRTRAYGAAMCLRAHIEGEDELVSRLLGPGGGDRDRRWQDWLDRDESPVPPPLDRDYPGLSTAREILQRLTVRNESQRAKMAGGLERVAEAVLNAYGAAASEEPTAPGPRAGAASSLAGWPRLRPVLLGAAALVVAVVGVYVLTSMLGGRKTPSIEPSDPVAATPRRSATGTPPAGWSSTVAGTPAAVPGTTSSSGKPPPPTPASPPAAPASPSLSIVFGDKHEVPVPLVGDRFVLDEEHLDAVSARLVVEVASDATKPLTLRLWPATYWKGGSGVPDGSGDPLSAPRLLERRGETWTQPKALDCFRCDVPPGAGIKRFEWTTTFEGGVAFRGLLTYAKEHGKPAWISASDLVLQDDANLFLARVAMPGGRILDAFITKGRRAAAPGTPPSPPGATPVPSVSTPASPPVPPTSPGPADAVSFGVPASIVLLGVDGTEIRTALPKDGAVLLAGKDLEARSVRLALKPTATPDVARVVTLWPAGYWTPQVGSGTPKKQPAVGAQILERRPGTKTFVKVPDEFESFESAVPAGSGGAELAWTLDVGPDFRFSDFLAVAAKRGWAIHRVTDQPAEASLADSTLPLLLCRVAIDGVTAFDVGLDAGAVPANWGSKASAIPVPSTTAPSTATPPSGTPPTSAPPMATPPAAPPPTGLPPTSAPPTTAPTPPASSAAATAPPLLLTLVGADGTPIRSLASVGDTVALESADAKASSLRLTVRVPAGGGTPRIVRVWPATYWHESAAASTPTKRVPPRSRVFERKPGKASFAPVGDDFACVERAVPAAGTETSIAWTLDLDGAASDFLAVSARRGWAIYRAPADLSVDIAPDSVAPLLLARVEIEGGATMDVTLAAGKVPPTWGRASAVAPPAATASVPPDAPVLEITRADGTLESLSPTEGVFTLDGDALDAKGVRLRFEVPAGGASQKLLLWPASYWAPEGDTPEGRAAIYPSALASGLRSWNGKGWEKVSADTMQHEVTVKESHKVRWTCVAFGGRSPLHFGSAGPKGGYFTTEDRSAAGSDAPLLVGRIRVGTKPFDVWVKSPLRPTATTSPDDESSVRLRLEDGRLIRPVGGVIRVPKIDQGGRGLTILVPLRGPDKTPTSVDVWPHDLWEPGKSSESKHGNLQSIRRFGGATWVAPDPVDGRLYKDTREIHLVKTDRTLSGLREWARTKLIHLYARVEDVGTRKDLASVPILLARVDVTDSEFVWVLLD